MVSRRLSPVRLAALACALVAAAVAPAAASARPNIVLVLTDDQRWDTLGVMPTVQRELVAKGVTFTNAFAVNPLCCPSRASFLTGRYSHSTGVYDNELPYGGVASFDDSSTLATWLAGVGYRTGYVGKYLNGYRQDFVPLGWHRWVGYAGGFFGYVLNVDGFVTPFGYDDASYSTDVLTREAVSFVEEPGPFFLVYAPYAPHGPATPASRHAAAFADLVPWRPPSYDEPDVADKPAWLRAQPPLSEHERANGDGFRRRQLASLLAVDDGVAAIVEALEESGRLEHTILVFASDNGLLWGEHRQVNRKVSAFEESIRIPLVVRYDALATGRRAEPRLVTNIDVAPTLAQLAGTTARGAEGRSLVPLLASSAASSGRWRQSFLIEHLQGRGPVTGVVPTYCAVRTTRFKYVVYSTREEELYDLAVDPHELENRAADPSLREQVFALRLDLKELCDPPPPGYELSWLCTLRGGGNATVLRGTGRGDTICGAAVGEVIRGHAGDDLLRAGGGPDRVDGGPGADELRGGAGADLLSGASGNDLVHARDGWPDRIVCGPGRDTVHADRRDATSRDCERVFRPRR